VCVPICICKASEFGQVTYRLKIRTKHPDMPATGLPSFLTDVTLCLAATVDNLVGSDYEQLHNIAPPADPNDPQVITLPPVGGENVILCPLCDVNYVLGFSRKSER
jgi:hypothetical protein